MDSYQLNERLVWQIQTLIVSQFVSDCRKQAIGICIQYGAFIAIRPAFVSKQKMHKLTQAHEIKFSDGFVRCLS